MRTYSRIVRRAKDLRRRLSPPEVRLWVRLRRARGSGLSFRRQHPVGNYILDFYCAQVRLAVEVDGWTHDTELAAERDFARTQWLERQDIVVMRVQAGEVMRDPDGVADEIWRRAAELAAQREAVKRLS